ncbi:hypothetical protein O5D80_005105 [Batrachochytrium dendrobatidis]|nr:hypothetical protein O5D80_005105 [Batrachochytrium dendrobatidis]
MSLINLSTTQVSVTDGNDVKLADSQKVALEQQIHQHPSSLDKDHPLPLVTTLPDKNDHSVLATAKIADKATENPSKTSHLLNVVALEKTASQDKLEASAIINAVDNGIHHFHGTSQKTNENSSTLLPYDDVRIESTADTFANFSEGVNRISGSADDALQALNPVADNHSESIESSNPATSTADDHSLARPSQTCTVAATPMRRSHLNRYYPITTSRSSPLANVITLYEDESDSEKDTTSSLKSYSKQSPPLVLDHDTTYTFKEQPVTEPAIPIELQPSLQQKIKPSSRDHNPSIKPRLEPPSDACSPLFNWFTSFWSKPERKQPQSSMNSYIHRSNQNLSRSSLDRNGLHGSNTTGWGERNSPLPRSPGGNKPSETLPITSKHPNTNTIPSDRPSTPLHTPSQTSPIHLINQPNPLLSPNPNYTVDNSPLETQMRAESFESRLSTSDRHRIILKGACPVCSGAQFISSDIICPACNGTGHSINTKPKKWWQIFSQRSHNYQRPISPSPNKFALEKDQAGPSMSTSKLEANAESDSRKKSVEAPKASPAMNLNPLSESVVMRDTNSSFPSPSSRSPSPHWSGSTRNQIPFASYNGMAAAIPELKSANYLDPNSDMPHIHDRANPLSTQLLSALDPGPVSSWAREVPSKVDTASYYIRVAPGGDHEILGDPLYLKAKYPSSSYHSISQYPSLENRSDQYNASYRPSSPISTHTLKSKNLVSTHVPADPVVESLESTRHEFEEPQWQFVSERLEKIFDDFQNGDSFTELADKWATSTTNHSSATVTLALEQPDSVHA